MCLIFFVCETPPCLPDGQCLPDEQLLCFLPITQV